MSPPPPRRPWRKWNAAVHRDLGYLAAALTLVYGISGIAVNHVHHWNPNYRQEKWTERIAPLAKDAPTEQLAAQARAALKPAGTYKSAFQPDEDTLHLFYKEATYAIDLESGRVLVEATRPRPVLYALNQLHLNAPKRLWTWIADLYALALVVLALTGMFILKGPKGITRRGAWLVGIGAAIPAAYWAWFAWLR